MTEPNYEVTTYRNANELQKSNAQWTLREGIYPHTEEQDLIGILEEFEQCYLFTYENIALAVGSLKDIKPGETDVYLDLIVVDPTHRKEGLGRKMLELLEIKALEAVDSTSVTIELEPFNDDSESFFEYMGYRPVGNDDIFTKVINRNEKNNV